MVKCFLTPEIMNWAEIERIYKAEVTAVPCVGVFDGREGNWKVVCDRVVEHVNISWAVLSNFLLTQ